MMRVTTRTTCRVCDGRLQLLLDYGQMPLAGGFLPPGDPQLSVTYPLRLAQCTNCTLMQVLDTVPSESIFDQYSYASSTTRTLREHFARMGPEIVALAEAQGKLVVEFGCNDGILLRPLLAAGAKVVGVDPSNVALRASQEQGWVLVNDYLTESVAAQIRATHGLARVVTGNNVMAHVDDIHAVMRAVTILLEDDGLFIFEVHYQGDLLASTQFDTVYHEHICYYSLVSLVCLLAQHRLRIIDVQRIPIHAGSIRVTAVRVSSHRTPTLAVIQMIEAEGEWDVGLFAHRVEVRRHSIQRLVQDLNAASRRVVAYGAAGRATIMLNYCELGPGLVEYVLDMSPLRYGRVVPGVMVPIVSPDVFHDDPPDYAILTAWNYEPEIVAKEQVFLDGGGRFVVPLPEVRLVGAV